MAYWLRPASTACAAPGWPAPDATGSALPRFDPVQLDAELIGDRDDRLTKCALDTAPQEKPVVEPWSPTLG